MTFISTAVAKTMFGMVDFSGNTDAALLALVAAMIGAIGWGIFCWFFGIPCSKSHSLIAGITGGAVAMNGWAGVVPSELSLIHICSRRARWPLSSCTSSPTRPRARR